MLVSSQENKKDLGYFKSNHWWQTKMAFQEEIDFKCVARTSGTKWVKTAPGHGHCHSLNLPHPGSTNCTKELALLSKQRPRKLATHLQTLQGQCPCLTGCDGATTCSSSRPHCTIQGLHDHWCYQGPYRHHGWQERDPCGGENGNSVQPDLVGLVQTSRKFNARGFIAGIFQHNTTQITRQSIISNSQPSCWGIFV